MPWPSELPYNPEDGSHLELYMDQSSPFFEGWYNKVSDPSSGESFFFIYTVVNPGPNMPEPRTAFVYCGRQKTLETVYQEFPVEEYSAEADYRDVKIGPDNRATALRFAGAVKEGAKTCSWDFMVHDPVPWKKTMGWLTGSTDRKVNWVVGTMTAAATGWVSFNGRRIEIAGARAYCDHNWGTVFPEEWVWMQANLFEDQGVALAVSGGVVEFGGKPVNAMMIGLLPGDGGIVTFRTQDLDDITWNAVKGEWRIAASNNEQRLVIVAACDPDRMFHLLVPTDKGMEPRAWEALDGSVEVSLESRNPETGEWRGVYTGSSSLAGVEIGE